MKLIQKGIQISWKKASTFSKTKNPSKMLYYTTRNPRNPEVFNIITNNLPLLEENQGMKNIFNTLQIIKSKRQSRSLKRILTRASFTSKNQRNHPLSKIATKPRCCTCPYLTEGSTFHFKIGSNFSVKTSMSCNS